jgi:hypothetical protein
MSSYCMEGRSRGNCGWRISIRGLVTSMEAPIPKEIGSTRAAGNRTAYCRQQAAECALAATTAIWGEVRQAYLSIEQAWLQLAPDINSDSKKAARPSTATECEGGL